MNPDDFTKEQRKHLVKTQKDYLAYFPPPLEPQIPTRMDLFNKLSEADRSLSELAGIGRTLPNPHLLIGPFLRREAVLSSRIEGTQASLSDLLFFEAASLKEKDQPDVREVANYVGALEYGLKRLEDIPVSIRLIKELHERLMSGVRGRNKTPGQFRRSQNWIGPPGCTLMEASYVPPPVPEMKRALDLFEKYLHEQSILPPLVRLSVIHYQFEAIHPFLDGNGRIGRLLITLLLCSEGLLPQPLLYLSAFFEKNRREYYEYLLDVSRKGDWNRWIGFFLDATADQSKDAIMRSDQLLALWKSYRVRVQEARVSALLLELIDQLFMYPVLTNKVASKRLSITPRSTQNNIENLVSAGILEEVTGRKRNRVYVAREIMSIIESEDISE